MTKQTTRLLICSDIHYASDLEKARGQYELNAIAKPWQRLLVHCFRNLVWLRNPFEHNRLVEQVLNPPEEPDLVVANGDFSCDSAFIGVSDPAAQKSAQEILTRFRKRFGGRFHATFGDHELGKRTLAGGRGGMRLASWEAAINQLQLEPFWTREVGEYVLMGVASSIIGFPIYEAEALPEERAGWKELRAEHMRQIRGAFERLRPTQKVILFCHDPSALPFLHDDELVGQKLDRLERTIIGHLHTPLVMWKSRLLAGMPVINFAGNAVRRMSRALHEAKKWDRFKVLLCPSLAGVQIRKKGGFYTAELGSPGAAALDFQFHRIYWNK